MTGHELKRLRQDLADAIGRPLSVADMAKLCSLAADTGATTMRKWEVTGPSKPVAEQLRLLAMASDRYPILDNFNIFDRHDVPACERPARREAFREQMRDEVRRRLG
jgi:hypothetical protein